MADNIKYISPIELRANDNTIGKIYRVYPAINYGSCFFVCISHPYYSSITAVSIPYNKNYEVYSSNVAGSSRGIFGLYKDKSNFYIQVKTAGADRLTINSLLTAIILEDVTNSVDLSTATII